MPTLSPAQHDAGCAGDKVVQHRSPLGSLSIGAIRNGQSTVADPPRYLGSEFPNLRLALLRSLDSARIHQAITHGHGPRRLKKRTSYRITLGPKSLLAYTASAVEKAS